MTDLQVALIIIFGIGGFVFLISKLRSRDSGRNVVGDGSAQRPDPKFGLKKE